MIRFAILKDVGKGDDKVVLEYSEKQVLERLQARVAEKLSRGVPKRKAPKFKHNRTDIHNAIADAFLDLAKEFKEKTVKLG